MARMRDRERSARKEHMKLWGRKLRLAAVAGVAAVGLIAAGLQFQRQHQPVGQFGGHRGQGRHGDGRAAGRRDL